MALYNRKPGELQISKSLQIIDSGLRSSSGRGIDAAKELYELSIRGESTFKLLGTSGFARNSFESHFDEINSIASKHDIALSFSDRNALTAAKRSFTNNDDAAGFFHNLQDIAGGVIVQGDTNKSERVEGMRMFGLVIPDLAPTVITNDIQNAALLETAAKKAEVAAVQAHEVTIDRTAPAANDRGGYALSAIAEKAAVATVAAEAAQNTAGLAEAARIAEVTNSVAVRQASESLRQTTSIPAAIAEMASARQPVENTVEKAEVAESSARRPGGDLSSLLKFHASNQNAQSQQAKLDPKHQEVAERLASSGVDIKALAGNFQASLSEKALPSNGPNASEIQNYAGANVSGAGRMA